MVIATAAELPAVVSLASFIMHMFFSLILFTLKVLIFMDVNGSSLPLLSRILTY